MRRPTCWLTSWSRSPESRTVSNTLFLLIVVIVLAIGFDFLNGVHDSSNIVATMISSRAIRPRVALAMTAVAEFSGPFIFGVAVANTIGNEIVSSEHLNMLVIVAALSSAIIWN